MALQKLLSQLRHNVLGSSSAVRGVYTNGIWTSLRKSGLLSHTGDLHTLRFPAPLNHALQSGNQFDAARSKFFWAGTAGESGPRFRHSIRIAGESGSTCRHSIPTEDEVKKWMKGAAGNKIYGSLVCIAVRQGGDEFFLPGTIIRSDGIVATSARFLSCLNSKELSETKLLSQLRHNVLGSSSAVRSVYTNGIWTSLRKSGLLSHMGDLHTLRFPAPLNHALQSGNQFDAARSKFFWAGTAGESGPRFRHSIQIAGESGSTCRHCIPTEDEVKKWMKGAAGNKIYGSLVCIAVRQGGEEFFLPGTIIRSDGIVATSARFLSCLNSKELSETVDVKVLNTNATYKGVLLDADFCSKIAFVKMMSPEPQAVATFGNLDYLYPGIPAVAASCHVQYNILRYAVPSYSCGHIGSVVNKIANGESHSRTSGAFIRAGVAPHVDVLGGPLIDPESGVIGVIYSCESQLKATPIVDVLKKLERLEKHRE